MATIKWAVTTEGTFDFNDPSNWQFGTVPGAFDIAQFDQPVFATVTGNATVAELLITQGSIVLTGSYTMSGAQPSELAIDGGLAAVLVDPGASVSGTGNISLTNGGALVIGGTVSGSSATNTDGQLIFLGAGAVFDVGTVNLGSGAIVSGPAGGFTVTNALQIAGSVSYTGTELLVVGTISGPGSIGVDGPVELDGSNTYSGGTTIGLFGQLAVGNPNALGTGGLTIGSLFPPTLLGTITETITNPLTVSGSSIIAAAHGQTLTLTPSSLAWDANTDDVVTFGAPGQDGTVAFGSAAGIVNNPSTYTVVVAAGTLRPTDAELGIVLGADRHTTIQAAGTLDAAGFTLMVNDLQGGGDITDTAGAAGLTVNSGNFSGVIGGPLGLTLNGALTLSGNNTYTGGTTINGGSTLTLGAGGTAGSVAGAIADNGVLAINHSDNFVVNDVSGTGQLQQTGPGITWLGSGLSYTGGTRISAGTLIVNDPAALGSGGLRISGGELLEGLSGTINNQLTMSNSFTIAAAHGQTLTTSTTHPWTLNGVIGQVVTFGAPGQDGTVAWSTPAGSSITPFGSAYDVLIRAGTLRANDSSFGVITQFAQHTTIRPAGTLDLAGVNAVVTGLQGGGHVINSGAATLLQVNGGNFSGVIGGPLTLQVTNGSLALSGNNTYTGGTTINSGTTLTLGAGGTTGSVPGIITDNGGLAINRSDNFVVNNVTGTGQLQQTGPGATTLGTGLSYTGGTSISAGTLVVNNPTALGPGGLTISGGELLASATETINNALTMSGSFTIAAAHGQTLAIGTTPWTYSASAGAVVAFGAAGQDGTLLWGSSSGTVVNPSAGYTFLVQPGTVRAAGNGLGVLVGNAAHTAIRPAGTLDAAGFTLTLNDLHGGGQITDSGAPAILFVTGGNFSGSISGAFTLEVPFGALTLAGNNNTYTGGTTIFASATLTLGNGGTTGSVPGAITDSGTLQFRHSGTFVEAGVISGNGNVVQSGPGTTVLTATNTYSGGTYLSGGTLEAQTPGAIGSGAVTFLAGARETFRIDGTTMPGNAILNFAGGDTIDLANIAADSWFYGGFELNLLHGRFTVASLNLSTPFGAHPLFALSGDGGGGTNIVLEPPPPQDLNADHLPDLVFQTPNNQFLGAVSTGAGFTTPQLWVQHGGTFLAGEAQYADVNDDGRGDVIVQGSDNRFYVSL